MPKSVPASATDPKRARGTSVSPLTPLLRRVRARDLDDTGYRRLRSLLFFDADVVHDALTDVLEMDGCTHAPCRCLLGAATAAERAAITVGGPEALDALMSRMFLRDCWRHRRIAVRRGRREVQVPVWRDEEDAYDEGDQDFGADQGSPVPFSREPVHAERRLNRLAYAKGVGVLFSLAGCSEKQRDCYVSTNVRDGRDIGNPMSAAQRRATCVARAKVDRYRETIGLVMRCQFEEVMEAGFFGFHLAEVGVPGWDAYLHALEEERPVDDAREAA